MGRQSKRVVVATQPIVRHTLLAELPAIFYINDPHAGPFPPIAQFTYDSDTQEISEFQEEHKRADTRYHTIYVRPSERSGVDLVGLTSGKFMRDPGCYDIPAVEQTSHGCSSAEQILHAARNRNAAVVTEVHLQFHPRGGGGYPAHIRSKTGGRVHWKRLSINENHTGFAHFKEARVYIRALQDLPSGTPIHIRYPDTFWSHPLVRFRYHTLKPALSRLQQHAVPGRLHHLLEPVQAQMQTQGVAQLGAVFDEAACRDIDRVLDHVVAEAKMACGETNLLLAARGKTYLELTYRQNRLDLIHPELLHFAEFAPWASLMPALMSSPATRVMHGGLFRLYPVANTGVQSTQNWHMDTDDSIEGVQTGPRSMLVVVALTDVLVDERGPTEVWLSTTKQRESRSNPGFLDDATRESLVFPPGQTRKIYLRRGDLMFLDGRTLHRGTTNSSDTTRDWLYFVYGRDALSHLHERFYEGPRSIFYDF